MYHILSLDGGGSWSILQLLTLKEKYGNLSGHEILKKFDLVIANSGGSIVLAALAENWKLEKAIQLFANRELKEQIFSKNKFLNRYFPVDYIRLLLPFGPKYSSAKKLEAFKKFFPEVHNRKMTELPDFIGKSSLKLVVSTYDALNNRAKFFKSYGEEKDFFDSVKLTQAIHGSSNAPIQYFDFPAKFKPLNRDFHYELWDGALGGFNNPVLAGLIEAFKLGVDFKDITIVSLGTSNNVMSTEEKEKYRLLKEMADSEKRKKLKFWKLGAQISFFVKTVFNQAKTILYQPPDWANYVTLIFLKKNLGDNITSRFIRLSPLIHIDEGMNREAKKLIKNLYKLDMDLTKDRDIELLKKCFEFWKAGKIKNQPIAYSITKENKIVYEAGDKNFLDAIKKWEQLPE
ncbi:MAG: patatin-like phospholipase family protein [Chitinophagales bacterium]|nr:patatin-like phospholipase family protein [Chitinophagales bacterium]